MRIGVLGPLEVRDAGGQVKPVGGLRLRSFLIRLALDGGRPVPADRLADDLWPQGQPADAAGAIQALASRLRSTAGRDLIEFSPAGYRITVAAGEVDAWAFERQVTIARGELESGDSAAGAARLRRALLLWRGPALADVADAPFAASAVTRLSELRLAATEDRIEAELALGRGAELVPEAEQLANEHPLRERLRGLLMRALYVAGRQAEALGVYEDTRQVLVSSLGIDPSPALAAVHLAILRGELDVPAITVPDRSGAEVSAGIGGRAVSGAGSGRPSLADRPPAGGIAVRRRSNLPAQLTSFVGRGDELSQLAALLEASRLITLTGPGGAGKTRLAVETAAELTVPDGVWFVPLAPVRDAADLPQAVLTAIAGPDTGWPADAMEAARLALLNPLDRLSETIAARELVLVLDNCEHLVDAAATLAARLLADAPGVRILATSREPLGVTGETLAPVPSLALPDEGAELASLAACPAVRLFTDRAAAVRPGFAVTAENAEPVVRICRALDGIPLAIELAAARLRTLTPDQVAARLDDRFALLSVGSRGTLPRHQTLRAIVDWSWDLLDDTERMILQRLSVFSGGATPESADQVCWLDGPAEQDVVGIIASLLDKSLVTAEGDRQVRYRLLETVRAYAADRLAEAGEAGQTAAAHTRYFLQLAEIAEPKLRSREQLDWLPRLSAEHDNFTAALRYVVQAQDFASAARFVRALSWYWITHDLDTEARDWAAAAVSLAPAQVPAELTDAHAVARLINLLSNMVADVKSDERQPGGPAAGESLAETLAGWPEFGQDTSHPLLALAGPILAAMTGNVDAVAASLSGIADHPDPWVRAARRLFAGHLAVNAGHIGSAAAELAAARALFEQIGDRLGLMICLTGLAEVAMARSAPADAVCLLEEARVLGAEGMAGGNWNVTVGVPLGWARALAGDTAAGRAELETAVRGAERLGELDDAVMGYVHLSEIARREGDLAQARALIGQAAAIAEPRRHRPDLAMAAAKCFSRLGCLAEQQGELEQAATWHRQALSVLDEASVMLTLKNQALATVVEGIAALTAARGEDKRAAELLGLAHGLQGYCNDASLEVARTRAASTLSQAAYDSAYAAGRELGPADALALLA
jgi:predicted ATPase/DNA-binding SARP family transcriptional activator